VSHALPEPSLVLQLGVALMVAAAMLPSSRRAKAPPPSGI
jgi:hypothetical protein